MTVLIIVLIAVILAILETISIIRADRRDGAASGTGSTPGAGTPKDKV